VPISVLLLALLVELPGCQPAGTERILTCSKTASPTGIPRSNEASERYTVILPADFTTGVKWPALIILHGLGRNYRTLVDAPETREALLRSKSVLILPDGGRSWWRDENRILDLVDSLSSRLNLDPRRMGCAGWSMGGYGSLRLITDHPDHFTFWGGIIGLVDFPNASYPANENHTVPPLFGPPDQWPSANPIHDIDKLRGKAIWFGTADQSFDAAMNRELARQLKESGIPHTFEVISGKHVFAVVSELLPKLLDSFDRFVH
jgi:enterochelin esterase-like enzyme